jgi:hypothetical protein
MRRRVGLRLDWGKENNRFGTHGEDQSTGSLASVRVPDFNTNGSHPHRITHSPCTY